MGWGGWRLAEGRWAAEELSGKFGETLGSPGTLGPDSLPTIVTLQSPQRSFWAPSGPKLETELKMSSRGLPAQGSKKVKIRVEKALKTGNFNSFLTFLTLLRLWFNFLGPGAGRPRELIFNSVSNFGPEGPKSPSGGIEGSQPNDMPELSPIIPFLCSVSWRVRNCVFKILDLGLRQGQSPVRGKASCWKQWHFLSILVPSAPVHPVHPPDTPPWKSLLSHQAINGKFQSSQK